MLNRFTYCSEILLGELVFIYSFPKRKGFALRLCLAILVSLSCGYFFFSFQDRRAIETFLGMLVLIAITVGGMFFSFEAPLPQILSACVSGVALQHIAYHIYRLTLLIPALHMPKRGDPRWEFIVSLAVILLFWVLGARHLAKQHYYREYDAVTGIAAVVIVFICLGITRFLRLAGDLNPYAVICTSIYPITCCVLALFVQYSLRDLVRMRSEYFTFQRLAKAQLLQYETSRENAQQLNIKYHDLKHKLVSLEHALPREEIDSMRELLEEYDGTYHTGLDPLDIVLNEKNLLCRAKQISLTVMGDGTILDFMKPMDVYALFGNILENAIEAVEGLEPPGRRQISMILENHGDLVYVNCTNYTSHSLLIGKDGLPETSKEVQKGYHGYGVRSVKGIAEKYRGGISIHSQEGMFSLSLHMVPQPLDTPLENLA